MRYSYDRRQAREATLICRGFPAVVEFTKRNLSLADKIVSGTLSAHELIGLTELRQIIVGGWWFVIESARDLEESKGYASDESTVQGEFGTYILADIASGEESEGSLALPIVLVGKRPKGYDPDKSPEGDSYVDPDRWPTVHLTEIHYLSGVGGKSWTKVPVSITVKV